MSAQPCDARRVDVEPRHDERMLASVEDLKQANVVVDTALARRHRRAQTLIGVGERRDELQRC